MAGIGFKLQKLLVEEIYLSTFKGFIYALVITSGPWLIMVFTLAILTIFCSFIMNPEDQLLFNLLLVHISVLTNIITGIFQLFFTRIFSDKLYEKKRMELPNVIMTNLIMTLAILCILVFPLFLIDSTFPENTPFQVKMLSFCLVFTLNIIWVLMNYISASDDLLAFVKQYLIGSTVSVALGGVLGYLYGVTGFYSGFYVGQAYIATVLFYQIIKVYGFPKKIYFSIIYEYPQYRVLLLSGFFLYVGMWIDKFIYWYGSSGQRISKVFYYHADYNSVFFVAFLLMTPIMAIFFIIMETSFYKSYYVYHEKYLYTESLERLKIGCDEIKNTVKKSLLYIIQIEGMIVVLGVLFSKNILTLTNIPVYQYPLFSVILIGVFFHMLALIICIVLYYFDLKYETLKIYSTFFGLNGILTWIFMQTGGGTSGLGYMVSAIIVFVFALWKLRVSMEDLNYLSFTRQKIQEQANLDDTYIPTTGCYGRYYIRNGERILIDS
jgi:uncharacterized membrane protein